MVRLLFILVLLLAMATPGLAAGRVALIVGNGDYPAAPLPNPSIDANIVARSLRGIGFDVEILENADLEAFDAAVTAFAARAEGADVALFYFAGHGFSITDAGMPQSYLMSTSARLESTSDVVLRSGGISLDHIIDTISRAARVSAFFIDACRNDPRVRGNRGGRGVDTIPTAGENEVFVALSTRLGNVAADGPPGSGSSFARAFATHIAEPDLRIDDAFTRIRIDVEAETGDAQSPDVLRYDLDRPLILASVSPDATVVESPSIVVQQPVRPVPDISRLVAAAEQEGELTVVALPHEWCGYGAILDGFRRRYPGVRITELSPDSGSSDQISFILNGGPGAPDVVDLGLGFADKAVDSGLLQPYRVATWDDIPGSIKHPDGLWYGGYFGVLAFGINRDLIGGSLPRTWADLMLPLYANSVALNADPRNSTSASMSVYAAGLASGTNADRAASAGLAFFQRLNANGNLVPVAGSARSFAQGTTPVTINWDYNLLAQRDALAGNPPMEVVVPTDSVLGVPFVQAISATAPHPNAARLWMEYLYSDEGQIGWLRGYCHPARYNALVRAGAIPAELAVRLPPADVYADVIFPSLAEQASARETIANQWHSTVGALVN